jgi:hypothetical protein
MNGNGTEGCHQMKFARAKGNAGPPYHWGDIFLASDELQFIHQIDSSNRFVTDTLSSVIKLGVACTFNYSFYKHEERCRLLLYIPFELCIVRIKQFDEVNKKRKV